MTQLLRFIRTLWLATSFGFIWFVFTGCGTTGQTETNVQPRPAADLTSTSDYLRVGDMVTISFSGVNDPPAIKHDERIKDDGHITLPYIGAIQAAGMTRAQLQENILTNYVPKYYTHLTVNVGSEARVFYVGGQVKSPGRYPFAGEMTVTKCVAAAGDFTDFAKRGAVEVTRANGKKEKVNCLDAQRHPEKDIPIFPDDRIYVPRRYF